MKTKISMSGMTWIKARMTINGETIDLKIIISANSVVLTMELHGL